MPPCHASGHARRHDIAHARAHVTNVVISPHQTWCSRKSFHVGPSQYPDAHFCITSGGILTLYATNYFGCFVKGLAFLVTVSCRVSDKLTIVNTGFITIST
jgi:hypothetical protein